jgi:hypothetical protein
MNCGPRPSRGAGARVESRSRAVRACLGRQPVRVAQVPLSLDTRLTPVRQGRIAGDAAMACGRSGFRASWGGESLGDQVLPSQADARSLLIAGLVTSAPDAEPGPVA